MESASLVALLFAGAIRAGGSALPHAPQVIAEARVEAAGVVGVPEQDSNFPAPAGLGG
ncbi:hypothetical protein ACETK3_07975 [Arthrobacter sp. E44]|uniref:hypothetical protein n=1 Tax=Arthrobacter sp. E44 TaxID=3341794 RepID=UPI0035A65A5D